MNFVAFDFETANRERSSICSIGFAVVEKGKIVGTDHIYVKPVPDYYDSFNTRLHGIHNGHTHDKPSFKEQWKALKKYFHNQTMVAHNAAFDCSVLRFTLDDAKIPYPDLTYHCTYRLAKELLPLSAFRLSDVSAHFKIKLEHHNAESDAKAAALVALRLCELKKVDSIEALSRSAGFTIGKIAAKSHNYIPYSKK